MVKECDFMKKNILIGNGINIAFSKNDDYKNYSIIQRLSQYLTTDRYNDVFENTITSDELMNMLEEMNKFFNNMLKGISALKLTQNEEELKTLLDISKRYHNKSKDLVSVGIEDYFFVMKMIYNKFGDENTPVNSLYAGLKYLFLDAIYNDGKIENLYKEMDCFKPELAKYEKIFTLNYDTNIDKLTDKKVYHIHGSFDILDDTYIPETFGGFSALHRENPPRVIKGKEHLFCNAIMAYSGEKKKEIMDIYSNGNAAKDNILWRLNNPYDIKAKQDLERLKNSTDKTNKENYKHILTCLEHPELRSTEYPIKEFENIDGELHILGLSPNNDSHIFRAINNNSSISRVIYFSAGDEDTAAAQKNISKSVQIRNVFKYWKKLGI
jgi:hypothetical protein